MHAERKYANVCLWPKADILTESRSGFHNGCFGEKSRHSDVSVTGKGEWLQPKVAESFEGGCEGLVERRLGRKRAVVQKLPSAANRIFLVYSSENSPKLGPSGGLNSERRHF